MRLNEKHLILHSQSIVENSMKDIDQAPRFNDYV